MRKTSTRFSSAIAVISSAYTSTAVVSAWAAGASAMERRSRSLIARLAVAEYQDGAQAAVCVASREPGEQVWVALVLGGHGIAAALKPTPQSPELVSRADQPDADRAGRVAGCEVGRAVICDPEARVNVPTVAAELKLGLRDYLSVHDGPSFLNGVAAAGPYLVQGRALALARPLVRARPPR